VDDVALVWLDPITRVPSVLRWTVAEMKPGNVEAT
jgi:hypothetical protein